MTVSQDSSASPGDTHLPWECFPNIAARSTLSQMCVSVPPPLWTPASLQLLIPPDPGPSRATQSWLYLLFLDHGSAAGALLTECSISVVQGPWTHVL